MIIYHHDNLAALLLSDKFDWSMILIELQDNITWLVIFHFLNIGYHYI